MQAGRRENILKTSWDSMYFFKKSKEVTALGGFATNGYQKKIIFFLKNIDKNTCKNILKLLRLDVFFKKK